MFHDGQFQFVPWVALPLQNNTASSIPNFFIPTPLHLDNSTLQSLDTTYDTLDQDLTRRLQKVRQDIGTKIGTKIWNEMPIYLRKLPKNVLKRKIKQILFEILASEDCYIDLTEIVQKVKLNLFSS